MIHTKPKIAIVGYGFVGRAMHQLFPDALLYDGDNHPILMTIGKKEKVVTYKDINSADVAFVCVPTPSKKDGHCDTSIVEEVISKLHTALIIIRSTIQPGTTDYLRKKYHKHIVFCPEYVGETVDHPLLNERSRTFIVLGGDKADTIKAIQVFQLVYNASIKIRQVTALEAEMIKYLENRHIAFTVAECNEAYDLCQKIGVDYNTIREAVYQDDPRMSPYWTFVYPTNRGFETKCIPKDVDAIAAFARDKKIPLEITEKILQVNKKWRKKK
jgi:UDPglucose 6-dehydrogenase